MSLEVVKKNFSFGSYATTFCPNFRLGSHLEKADALRRSQLIAAIEHGQPLDYSATWLCCGDFNFTLVDEELRQAEKSTDWLPFDRYAAGGGEMPGITLPGGDPTRPGKRIDYILGLVREEADASPAPRAKSF